MEQMILEAAHLQNLFNIIRDDEYTIIGPTVRDNAIIYDEIDAPQDLPQGWTDEQAAGTYRLQRQESPAYFGYTGTAFSWKKYLHPPAVRLLHSVRTDAGLTLNTQSDEAPRYAFVGVRPCELRAIQILDRVLLQGDFVDPTYYARRSNVLIVAVNCSQAGATCFCTSVGGSPHADAGYDLSLTEVINADAHYFVVDVGSEAGERVLERIPHHLATAEDAAAAKAVINATAANIGREVDTEDIKQVLYDNLEHPQWEKVAARCLACANCTMVCPTCFCNTVEDYTDLSGGEAERWRKWDSCFTSDFSYIHGGSVRQSGKTRYRQWLTHKFASWQDQFGTLGCVGCGRCITWCPAKIDITEEVRTIRTTSK